MTHTTWQPAETAPKDRAILITTDANYHPMEATIGIVKWNSAFSTYDCIMSGFAQTFNYWKELPLSPYEEIAQITRERAARRQDNDDFSIKIPVKIVIPPTPPSRFPITLPPWLPKPPWHKKKKEEEEYIHDCQSNTYPE